MKKTIALFVASILSVSLVAETVKLKITYKNQGISGHTVYVMVGDLSLGSGITNSGGEVSINVSTLPSKRIDVKGEKKCNGAEKNWKVQGYVVLDDNNYALLELDKPIAEAVEGSGGFMTEDMIVSSYGLVCGGSSNNSNSSHPLPQHSEKTEEDVNDSSTETSSQANSSTPTREEMLANQKVGYQNKINSLDKKIAKNQAQIDGGKLDAEKQKDTEYDIQEKQIEKKIAQNNLDRVNTEISNGSLNKEERDRFKETDKSLKEDLKSLKQKHKEALSTPAKTEVKDVNPEDSDLSDTDIANMETKDLKSKRIDYKSKLGAQKLKLKTRKKYMSPEEIAETEAKIKTLEANIAKLDAELSKRDGK